MKFPAELTHARHDSGAAGYLESLDAERTRLRTERQASQVSAQRFIATVRLVKAMGGGTVRCREMSGDGMPQA